VVGERVLFDKAETDETAILIAPALLIGPS
jgi:hypothetical protein